MRILWFSNIAFSDEEMSSTGTWLEGMAMALYQEYEGEVEIFNIAQGQVNDVLENKAKGVRQWILPAYNKYSSPSKKLVDIIVSIIKKASPDLIQIWGTESYWGELPIKEYFPRIPILLDMQGFMRSIVSNYYGDLTPTDLLRCISIKELLKPSSSLFQYRRRYKVSGGREKRILRQAQNVSVQSEWMAACVESQNCGCRMFRTRIALREPFYSANQWQRNEESSPVIFSTASTVSPLKGLYVLLKAFKVVVQKYPQCKLRLAGMMQEGIRKGGYARFIDNYLKRNKLEDSVVFLGALDTGKLIQEYQNCDVFVNPSCVESYSLVLAEAMFLGVPTVASYVGAMGELGDDEISVLYFPKHDYAMCAHQIIRIIENKDLANLLSKNAMLKASMRNNVKLVAETQFQIYKMLLSEQGC